MKFAAIIDNQSVEIELETLTANALRAQINGRTYAVEVKAVEPGVYWFNWNHRVIEVTVSSVSDAFIASIRGRQLPVEILDARTALKKLAHRGDTGAVEIKAPMPGKIVKVLVLEGSEVKANQGILVMEAMKMQNEIKSSKKGRVGKIYVGEGITVNSGDVLATVE